LTHFLHQKPGLVVATPLIDDAFRRFLTPPVDNAFALSTTGGGEVEQWCSSYAHQGTKCFEANSPLFFSPSKNQVMTFDAKSRQSTCIGG
jgi:hypothetical protein